MQAVDEEVIAETRWGCVEKSLDTPRPPWEASPYGVVSLFAMLDFAAHTFAEIAHRIGLALGRIGDEQDENVLRDSISQLVVKGSWLGLEVTCKQAVALMGEVARENPDKVRWIEGERLPVVSGELSGRRTSYHLEAIYSTMVSELEAIVFKAIPKERKRYIKPDAKGVAEWLNGSVLASGFPTAFRELEKAAECYALGQPTACVFHCMRALEVGLASLAKPFNVASDNANWQNIINDLERAIRALGSQPKSQQRIDDEKFFGAAASHLYFVKNAWRNHASHARETYSDDEAMRILQRTRDFMESLCPRLQE